MSGRSDFERICQDLKKLNRKIASLRNRRGRHYRRRRGSSDAGSDRSPSSVDKFSTSPSPSPALKRCRRFSTKPEAVLPRRTRIRRLDTSSDSDASTREREEYAIDNAIASDHSDVICNGRLQFIRLDIFILFYLNF